MKTNLKIISYIMLCLLFISATCCRNDKDCHYNVYIKNNSDKTIYFYLSTLYPDTLYLYVNPTVAGDEYKVKPHQTTNDSHNSCVEGYYYRTQKLIYFIYDAQTLETIPWDTVTKKYMILKRYELTLHDLDSLNWTITYP
jgi:hypothetical protein